MTWIFPKISPGGGGTGTVTGVTAANATVVIGGTPTVAPTVRTGTLDVIATLEAPVAAVALNAQKITGLANGSAATDALAVGQVLAAGVIPIADLADPTTGKVIGSASNAAAAVFPPGHKFDSASITAPVSITATTEGTANTCIDGNSVTYDGAEVRVEVFTPDLLYPAGGVITVVLLRDTTVLGTATFNGTPTGVQVPVTIPTYDTPSAGAHTYHVKAFVNSGTGSFGAGTGGSGAALAATLRVTKT